MSSPTRCTNNSPPTTCAAVWPRPNRGSPRTSCSARRPASTSTPGSPPTCWTGGSRARHHCSAPPTWCRRLVDRTGTAPAHGDPGDDNGSEARTDHEDDACHLTAPVCCCTDDPPSSRYYSPTWVVRTSPVATTAPG